jgi:hypothetical protein
MDYEATLAHPVAVVFGHLAAPPRLATGCRKWPP